MDKYQEITGARNLLGLEETASMKEIKAGYRKLMVKWHPDKCVENRDKCAEMTKRIISAYNTIQNYCREYRYSFSRETVKRHLSPDQWWNERFGDDPLWGKKSEND